MWSSTRNSAIWTKMATSDRPCGCTPHGQANVFPNCSICPSPNETTPPRRLTAPEPKGGESLGTVDEVRERAQAAGLPITQATQLQEIAPRFRLQTPFKVLRPSTAPVAREESEL